MPDSLKKGDVRLYDKYLFWDVWWHVICNATFFYHPITKMQLKIPLNSNAPNSQLKLLKLCSANSFFSIFCFCKISLVITRSMLKRLPSFFTIWQPKGLFSNPAKKYSLLQGETGTMSHYYGRVTLSRLLYYCRDTLVRFLTKSVIETIWSLLESTGTYFHCQ